MNDTGTVSRKFVLHFTAPVFAYQEANINRVQFISLPCHASTRHDVYKNNVIWCSLVQTLLLPVRHTATSITSTFFFILQSGNLCPDCLRRFSCIELTYTKQRAYGRYRTQPISKGTVHISLFTQTFHHNIEIERVLSLRECHYFLGMQTEAPI